MNISSRNDITVITVVQNEANVGSSESRKHFLSGLLMKIESVRRTFFLHK